MWRHIGMARPRARRDGQDQDVSATRGGTSRMRTGWALTGLTLGFGLLFAVGPRAQQETTALSLKEVPIPKPTAAIIDCIDNKCPDPNSAPDKDALPIEGPA